ncbi:MAG: winged helix-turn-helix domain-containing protein [Elusimicrobiota bacterium]
MFKKPKVLFAGYKTIPKELEEINECCQTKASSLTIPGRISLSNYDVVVIKDKRIEVIKSIKRSANNTEILLIMDAKPSKIEEKEFYSAGVNSIVVKTAKPEVFRDKVRRVLGHVAKIENDKPHATAGKYELWVFPMELKVGSKYIPLKYKEFQFLLMLMKAYPKLATRRDMYDIIWCKKEVKGGKELDSVVMRLRRKLGPNRDMIKTVVNKGYFIV